MTRLVHWRLLVAVILLAIAPVQAAWAHAQLLSSEPASEALLQVPPTELRMLFNEPISPLSAKLVRPDATTLDLTGKAEGGVTLTVPLPGLTEGTHILSWRVVSSDGHPVAGSLIFSVGQVSGAATVAPATDAVISFGLWLGKAIVFVALFVGVGGAVFSAVTPLPRRAHRLSVALVLVGLALGVLTLGLHGADALGLPFASLLDGAVWTTALSTSYGATVLALTLAFAMALVSLVLSLGGLSVGLALAAGIIGALSLALSGHASAADPQWLTRPAVFLHVGSVMVWVGAFYPLCLLLRERNDAADRSLAVFSRRIPYAVAALVVSGLALAAIQLGPFGSHWLSPYGFLLGAKLALLVFLFGLALWNRLWLTKPALAGDLAARSYLRRSIVIEMALVVIILGLVAGWRFTPLPRAYANMPVAITAEPQLLHLMKGDVMAMVMLSPGSTGPSTFDIQISDATGVPIPVQDVRLTLSSPALGIEPIKRAAVDLEGAWQVKDLTIPAAGPWEVQIDIRVSRFELVGLEASFDIH